MSKNQAMMIQCLAARSNQRRVTIGGTEYIFIRDDKGRLVAPVENPDHIQRFLSITEGYKILQGTAPAEPLSGLGAAKIEDATVATLTVTTPEPTPEPTPAEDANATNTPDTQIATPVDADKPLADMDTDELRAVFEAEVGRKPHPQSKDATLRAQIEAAREDKGGAA